MKIAFCHYDAPENIINGFLKKWKMYQFIDIPTYIDHSKDTIDPDVVVDSSKQMMDDQRILTGRMCDTLISNFEKTHVLYNNTMLNNLADSILSVESGLISDTDFLTTQFHITKNMFKFIDIIFWLKDESETDNSWIQATREIYKQYDADSWNQAELIFPLTDRPAFIEIPFDPENPKTAIENMAEFLDREGNIYEPGGLDLGNDLKDIKNGLTDSEIKKFFASQS